MNPQTPSPPFPFYYHSLSPPPRWRNHFPNRYHIFLICLAGEYLLLQITLGKKSF
ncbi:hypothetical protein L873DRAFT_1811936 [Choiromyces venosus 120613-1]|uniref:Uncharacterized protein n=1 Tax=Choiromyces venosus 120613-1 TaxID=1336337 RepID=A0A3N4JCS2_9PEZI|nr:hypothetical protein L873DRAFT_1811936 [Choiromyces venosus 120613-1]